MDDNRHYTWEMVTKRLHMEFHLPIERGHVFTHPRLTY